MEGKEGKKDAEKVCPEKLDKFLFDNGMKDPTKLQHCCVSTVLRFGRSAESTKKTLVDSYKFQNVEEPDFMPSPTPLKEQTRRAERSEERQFGTLSPGPVTCGGCGTKPGFQDPSSGLYHQFCSQACKEARSAHEVRGRKGKWRSQRPERSERNLLLFSFTGMQLLTA